MKWGPGCIFKIRWSGKPSVKWQLSNYTCTLSRSGSYISEQTGTVWFKFCGFSIAWFSLSCWSPRKPCAVRSVLEWAEVCLRKARSQVNQKKTLQSQGCSLKSEEPDWEDQDQIVMTGWRQLGGVKKLDNLWSASEVASPFLVCMRAQGKEQISLPVLFAVYTALLFTDFRLFLAVF